MSNTAYVILAGGRGSRMGRVGDKLCKALVPLSQQAVISRIIALAPLGAEIIISTGHLGNQLHDYIELAHPSIAKSVRWVHTPTGGPGAAVLATREVVGDRDMVITSCDTLWEPDPGLWDLRNSWAAYAPMPAGSPPERWCRLGINESGNVWAIADKQPAPVEHVNKVYTGLTCIMKADLSVFWDGLARNGFISGEHQVSGGLSALADTGHLRGVRIQWTDTGDMMAYRRAVMLHDGYDWSKSGQATWVLPSENRVVKWHADKTMTKRLAERRSWIAAQVHGNTGVPRVVAQRDEMLAMNYTPGVTGYDAVKTEADISALLLSPIVRGIMSPVTVTEATMIDACYRFYCHKTIQRIQMLRQPLRRLAMEVYDDVVTPAQTVNIITNARPAVFHGDFNLGNVVFDGRDWYLIDWRDTFCEPESNQLWGDWRYDAAKFLAGLRVRWDWARRGDVTPWELGKRLYPFAKSMLCTAPGTEEIGVLSLLSSAPLHESPLDEVLIARAAEWASELL